MAHLVAKTCTLSLKNVPHCHSNDKLWVLKGLVVGHKGFANRLRK